MPFLDEVDLPSSERGPVADWAFSRLALSWAQEGMVRSFHFEENIGSGGILVVNFARS